MSLPIINFKFTNTDVNENLQDIVTSKFQSLEHFIGSETDVTIDVEFEKEADQQSGKVFRVECNWKLHGELFRADASELNFEAAIDEVQAELDKELRRANDKRHTLIKKGGREIKEMMRGE